MLVVIETFAELEEVNGDKDQRLIMCTCENMEGC